MRRDRGGVHRGERLVQLRAHLEGERRALRRAPLTAGQKERIRKRVVEMLCAGYLPREYRQYAKLARRIGLGDMLSRVEREADLNNVWVQRYYEYFKGHAAG